MTSQADTDKENVPATQHVTPTETAEETASKLKQTSETSRETPETRKETVKTQAENGDEDRGDDTATEEHTSTEPETSEPLLTETEPATEETKPETQRAAKETAETPVAVTPTCQLGDTEKVTGTDEVGATDQIVQTEGQTDQADNKETAETAAETAETAETAAETAETATGTAETAVQTAETAKTASDTNGNVDVDMGESGEAAGDSSAVESNEVKETPAEENASMNDEDSQTVGEDYPMGEGSKQETEKKETEKKTETETETPKKETETPKKETETESPKKEAETGTPNAETGGEDTETEEKKSKKGKSKTPRKTRRRRMETATEEESPVYLNVREHLPDGWSKPLYSLIAEDSWTSSERKTRLNYRVARGLYVHSGAAWLSDKCTPMSGSALPQEHVEGPTFIVRELCSALQGQLAGNENLFDKSYCSLNRAAARSALDPLKVKSMLSFVEPKMIKCGTEKELLHFLPGDLIAGMLSQQCRALVASSQMWPSHLFCAPLHLQQYAPILFIHLLAYFGQEGSLSKFFELVLGANNDALKQLQDIHDEKLKPAQTHTRRRRLEGDSLNKTFPMSVEEKTLFLALCDEVDKRVDEIRSLCRLGVPTDQPVVATSDIKCGETVFTVSGDLIGRYTAALRNHVYQQCGEIQPNLVNVELDEESELVDTIVKESHKFLHSSPTAYLDATLSCKEQDWMMGSSRLRGKEYTGKAEAERGKLLKLLGSTSEKGNTKLHIEKPDLAVRDGLITNHKVTINVIADQDIPKGTTLVLDASFKRSTWAEIAADSSESE